MIRRFAAGLLCLMSGFVPFAETAHVQAAQEQASNLAFSGSEAEAYAKFRKLATFEGYVFRDLKNHKVFSKLENKVLDPENNAYLKATGLKVFTLHVDELPPGAFNTKHRGPVEGVDFVLSGRGYTILEPVGEKPQKIEWKEGDLISIPANAWHQSFNLDTQKPARLLGIGDGGLVASLGVPPLPDPENERYSNEMKEHLKKSKP